MKLNRIFSVVVLACLIFSGTLANAIFVPATLSYQGALTDTAGTPVNGLKDMTFKLYDVATGGTAFWSETQGQVYVTNGRFATVLGKITPMDPTLFSADVYLGITVDPENEMTPRQQLTSIAFAFNATNATRATKADNGVPVGGIIMWRGTTAPNGWALCDGNNGTPDLRDRFIVGSGNTYTLNAKGGTVEHFHAAASEGGDLRAAIGRGENGGHIVYSNSPARNPSSNTPLNNIGRSGVYHTTWNTGGVSELATAAQVYGFTSTGKEGVPGLGTAVSKLYGSLPPYYALAYIMKL